MITTQRKRELLQALREAIEQLQLTQELDKTEVGPFLDAIEEHNHRISNELGNIRALMD